MSYYFPKTSFYVSTAMINANKNFPQGKQTQPE